MTPRPTALVVLSMLCACGASNPPVEGARAEVTPIDADGDGVTNEHDECPTEPGSVQAAGCPDADGDRVPDSRDACPDAREDFNGIEDNDGCPDDRDRDGVPDETDHCPHVPEQFDGFEDEDGCPDPDNDADGVLDWQDQCPNEPEDIDNHQDDDGCPDPDNDSDGLPDTEDQCPNRPAGEARDPDRPGCSAFPHPPDSDWRVVILQRVEFALRTSRMPRRSRAIAEAVLQIMNREPGLAWAVRVEGHASQGEPRAMQLSKERALSVAQWLVDQGIGRERLFPFGCASALPIADNGTRAGRQDNRRVEFHILDPEPAGGARSTPAGACERVLQGEEP